MMPATSLKKNRIEKFYILPQPPQFISAQIQQGYQVLLTATV